MDDSTFDKLTRSLASPSRRGLLGTALGGVLAALGSDVVEAKKKKKKKKKKKGGGGQAPPADDVSGVAPSCFATCNGCCDGAGHCQPGNTNSACETNGYPCENCAAQGEVCNQYQSCQCDAQACKSRGGCCFEGRCVVGEDPEHCCASEGEDCLRGCCPGLYCHPSSFTCLCQGRGDVCNVEAREARPCCKGAPCENGTCSRHCRYWGCPGGSTCCESTGECFSTTWTNCRHPNGSLFYCDNPCCQVCCVSPSRNNAGCGSSCVEEEGFHAAPPATCGG